MSVTPDAVYAETRAQLSEALRRGFPPAVVAEALALQDTIGYEGNPVAYLEAVTAVVLPFLHAKVAAREAELAVIRGQAAAREWQMAVLLTQYVPDRFH